MELAKELAEDKLSAKGLAIELRPSRLFPAGLTLPSPPEVTESVMAVNPDHTVGVPGDFLPPTASCALLFNCISANICCTVCTGWDGWGARAKTWVVEPDPWWGKSMRATLRLFAWKVPFRPETGREAAEARACQGLPCPKGAERSRLNLGSLVCEASASKDDMPTLLLLWARLPDLTEMSWDVSGEPSREVWDRLRDPMGLSKADVGLLTEPLKEVAC